jgi:LacI family transcriptional regulator
LPTPKKQESRKSARNEEPGRKPAGLKEIAEYLGLSSASVSIVINNAPLAKSMTPQTRARILEAAKKFNYRPNLVARALSKRESHTVGVIAPESSDGYYTRVMRGIEESLLESGYLYFTVSHLTRPHLISEYPVDGIIFLNTAMEENPGIPAVSISYTAPDDSITSVVIDQQLGTRQALEHLKALGHRRILMMKGQRSCLEAEDRWRLLLQAAGELGIRAHPELFLQMDDDQLTPEHAFGKVTEFLKHRRDFTAVCAFNDTSALGAIRALADVGLRCPADVSVVGFDDIGVADFYTPRLTTVRQPLEEMGRRAVENLIARIKQPGGAYPPRIVLQPEIVIRESTRRLERKLTARPRAAAAHPAKRLEDAQEQRA